MASNRLQGAIFTVMVVRVVDPYDPGLDQEVGRQVELSPRFFADAPAVIDLGDCLGCTAEADFEVLKQTLRKHRLVPVGVQRVTPVQRRLAVAAGLAVFGAPAGGRARAVESSAGSAAADGSAGKRGPSQTRLVTQPVRSGMQIYAQGGDLIVLAPVSAGAEVIADGHIHVYGALRGRAIAGATGDTSARIFAHRLEAELVCVAGRYFVSDAIAPEYLKHAAQVALIGDQLRILPGWG
jgi:septum site-determining protein MinC